MRLKNLILFMGWLLATFSVAAAGLTLTASDTVTVMPSGPRKGEKSKIYLNVQGSDSDRFASYGVLDFDTSQIALPGGNFTFKEITLRMRHAPSKFSNEGNFKVWLLLDTPQPINSNQSTIAFDPYSRPAGVGRSLGIIRPLGSSQSYTKVGSFGDELTYTMRPSESMIQALASTIRDKGTVRLILTPGTPSVAATFTGIEWEDRDNGTSGAPQLELALNEL